MGVWDGVKESSKKKLVISTCRNNVRRTNGREQMPRKWRGDGAEEDRNCILDCIKGDPERMGKE